MCGCVTDAAFISDVAAVRSAGRSRRRNLRQIKVRKIEICYQLVDGPD